MTEDITAQLEPEALEPIAPSEFLAMRLADLISRALDLAAIAARAGDAEESAICRAAAIDMGRTLEMLR